MPDFIRNPQDLSISDLSPNRPTIGNDLPVVVWRLIRLVGFYDILGDDVEAVSYFAGKKIGKMLKAGNLDDLQKQLMDLKVGKIECRIDANMIRVSIRECMTCAGITPPLGQPICHLESGLVAGALENIYAEKKISAKETRCIGGLGDEVCLIECTII